MGLLSFLDRANGKRGSVDFRRLKDHDVVVLVDDSTRMLKKGRWGEVGFWINPQCALCSSILGARGDGRARYKSPQVQQPRDRRPFPEPAKTRGYKPQGQLGLLRLSGFVHAKAKHKTRQTKSETRKLFKETTLYYGQPVGTRLNDLLDQYVQARGCTLGSEKRKRDILVVSDGAPCEPARSTSIHCAYTLSADDLESALVNISKRLDELERPKPQVGGRS